MLLISPYSAEHKSIEPTIIQSAIAALNDPASVYFQTPGSSRPHATRLAALDQPLSSLRSVLRWAYFGYLYYYPEVRYGMCLMRYVSNADAAAVYEAPIDSGLDDASVLAGSVAPENARSAAANDDVPLPTNAYHTLAVTVQRMLHQFVCTEPTGGSAGAGAVDRCALAQRHALPADEATLRMYRTLALDMAERWMRSRRLLQPMLNETGARRVRHMADAVLDGMLRGTRERLVPGLFGCSQHYVLELLWRAVETWL